ncbi:MAG: heavy metal translocating P-type ATPase [Pseudomonadota bacterium]
MTARCFHCDDTIHAGTLVRATLASGTVDVCCIGCQAAAQFIDSAGLGGFYTHRSISEAQQLRPTTHDYASYDQAAMLERYVIQHDAASEVTLYVSDISCAACIWLIERLLGDQPGVQQVSANPVSRRVTVHWDRNTLPLSAVLALLAHVGFDAEPVIPGTQSDSERRDYRQAIRRLVVAGVFGMQVMMFAIGLYAGEFYGMSEGSAQLLRVTSLVAVLPIIGFAAWPFFRNAFYSLRRGRPGMDVPVSLAISIAFLASLLATLGLGNAVYFDSIAMFVLLLCTSRFLEMRARHRADDHARALQRMLPTTARRITASGDVESMPVDALAVDDLLRFSAGDVVAADTQLTHGQLGIDNSMMTGESDTVICAAGDTVLAGSRVVSGGADGQVTATGNATALAEVARLIEQAQQDRSAWQSIADRIASVFTLAVLGIAGITAALWWQWQPSRTLDVVLAVLIVACPCALALAAPTALARAAGSLARYGLLIVRSRVLELIRANTTIVLDKTGTLTTGKPAIHTVNLQTENTMDQDSVLRIAAALEASSTHALAGLFGPYGDDRVRADGSAQESIGAGVEGTIDGVRYRVGSRAFVCALSDTQTDTLPTPEMTEVCVGDSAGVLARIHVCDQLRPDTGETLHALRQAGCAIVVASGDNAAAVGSVAAQLDLDNWHSDMTPTDKLALVRSLKRDGTTVIMIGDGVNDAPVLAAADASIAIADGTALARASADALLLGKSLRPLQTLMATAQKTRRIITQSLAWAASYNIIAITLAATGVVAPWMAAIGMSASSLLVVGNALRIGATSSTTADPHTTLHKAIV